MTVASVQQVALEEAEELLRDRDLSAALAAWHYAENLGADPDRCAAGRWQTYMLLGKFEEAWRESDAIRRRGALDPHRFWEGEELTGKRVILRCLHGLGDAVQFLRYAPGLRAQASKLIVEVPPNLLTLAPALDGIGEVISWGESAPPFVPHWDVQVEVNELPYAFRTQSCDLPVATEYLRLPHALRCNAELRSFDRSRFRVGVVWAGGLWNASRSVPFNLLLPIFQTSNCEFWNLQGGRSREAWRSLSGGSHLHSAQECTGSVTKLAALIAQLDLVLTCDTLAAHLAGALGTTAWVMLEYAADWRWQHDRLDSPWYPSLRLFRQPHAGDWRTVIENVRISLEQCASSRASRDC